MVSNHLFPRLKPLTCLQSSSMPKTSLYRICLKLPSTHSSHPFIHSSVLSLLRINYKTFTLYRIPYTLYHFSIPGGMSPHYVAKQTLLAVARGDADLVLADAKTCAAIAAKNSLPDLLSKLTRQKK